MEALIGIGEGEHRHRVYEPDAGKGTNEEALARFAKMLSDERRLRQSNINSY
ncbi:hypothetical protein ACP4OV_011412 [Aristida adscensionis]